MTEQKSIGILDVEANGLLHEATRLWCAVVKDLKDGSIRRFSPDNVDDLCSYLSNFDVIIGHNICQYDFPLLRKLYGWEFKGQMIDTLLMSRTQRPNRVVPPDYTGDAGPNSVEVWAHRLGGQQKVEQEQWTEYDPNMLVRCEADVNIQHKIYDELLREGKDEGWEQCHRLNARLFYLLQKQEEYGWTVDQDHMHRCVHFLTRWIDRIDRAITPKLPWICEPLEAKEKGERKYVKKPFKINGEYTEAVHKYFPDDPSAVAGPFSRVSFRILDLDSNAEVKQFLLESGWEPAEWNMKDGQRTSPKFSKDDKFEGIQGSLGRLIARRIQCRQRKSIVEGWLNSIRDDGRISPIASGMATTGRIKHSGIVNVPSPGSKAFFARWMRRIFIARDGWVLVGVDSKGNQVRQLAARMGDEEFTTAALTGNSDDGTDIHSINQRRAGVPSRNLAKNVLYGIMFGAGNAKVGKLIKQGPSEGGILKQKILDVMPKLTELLQNLSKQWRATAKRKYNPKFRRMEWTDGYIIGLDGRRIFVEHEHTILVYYLQSDEAIQMAAAYCWLYNQLEKAGYKHGKDWGFCIWYHDEFQIECRPEIKEEVASLARESIAWAGRFFKIPIKHEGDSKFGKNWLETH